jgi:hypothetical protein
MLDICVPPYFLVITGQSHVLCVCMHPCWITLAKCPCLCLQEKDNIARGCTIRHLTGYVSGHLTVSAKTHRNSKRDMRLVSHGDRFWFGGPTSIPRLNPEHTAMKKDIVMTTCVSCIKAF